MVAHPHPWAAQGARLHCHTQRGTGTSCGAYLDAAVSGPVAWDWQLPGLGTYVGLRQGTLGDPGPAGALPGSSDFPLQAGFGKWPLNVEGMRVKWASPV